MQTTFPQWKKVGHEVSLGFSHSGSCTIFFWATGLRSRTTKGMAAARIALLVLLALAMVWAHPTMYKLNADAKLEPDLVPVSSTVIPLPIYQVGYAIDIAKGSKGHKTVIQKPEGPVTLVTVHSKKKALPTEKAKTVESSSVKELKNEEFAGH